MLQFLIYGLPFFATSAREISLTVIKYSSYADHVSHVNHLTTSTLLNSQNATATAADPATSNQVRIAAPGIALAPLVVCTMDY